MLIFVLGVFSFLFFTCIGVLLLNQVFEKKMVIYRRISPLLVSKSNNDHFEEEEELNNKTFYTRMIQPVILKCKHIAVGRMPKNKLAKIEQKLHAAGQPFGMSAGDFVLLQFILPTIVFLLFSLVLVPSIDNKGKVMILATLVSFFTYVYTNYYLGAKERQRTKLINKAMPDFFDMLNVSIEAGMGLDGALKKVCNQIDSPLSEEFLSALEDMKLGKSRKQAFIDLRDRVSSDFFKSVMGSIIQADQMGIGMSKVLRTQTQRIREKQRFNAKEQAMKAPVKMLIPMVLFIFPTLFIVLIGPVIINLIIQFL